MERTNLKQPMRVLRDLRFQRTALLAFVYLIETIFDKLETINEPVTNARLGCAFKLWTNLWITCGSSVDTLVR